MQWASHARLERIVILLVRNSSMNASHAQPTIHAHPCVPSLHSHVVMVTSVLSAPSHQHPTHACPVPTYHPSSHPACYDPIVGNARKATTVQVEPVFQHHVMPVHSVQLAALHPPHHHAHWGAISRVEVASRRRIVRCVRQGIIAPMVPVLPCHAHPALTIPMPIVHSLPTVSHVSLVKHAQPMA